MQKGSSLRLEGVTKSFGPTRVLDGITLDVEPGEFVSLVGASGCGKSTLLRIIAGLEVQDQGHVAIADRIVDHLGPRQRNIAMVFQSYALYPHMSVYDNIALPLTVSRLSLAERLPLVKYLSPRRPRIAREIGAEVKAVAGQLKLDQLLARKPGQLSGGQRQRVALARAMVRDPSLFLMDEPLSNLDAQLRVHMRDELAELHGRLGATFIYVTHDQVEAMTMSTRVAMMDRGRLEQVGSPRELYERPQTLAVARFIGSPAINVVPGTVAEGGRLVVAGTLLPLIVPLAPGATVALGVRPEAVRIGGHDGWPSVMGRVRRVEHHGAERLIYVDLDTPLEGSAIVREQSGEDAGSVHEVGRPVPLALDPARIHVFDAAGKRVTLVSSGLAGARHDGADRARASA